MGSIIVNAREGPARVDDADVILYDITVSQSEAAQQNQITEGHPKRCFGMSLNL